MRARVTASDVAARAGVSRTAVSFVFNDRAQGMVAPDAIERVRAAAKELGYEPDRVARSLRTKRTHAIGIMTDSITTSPFAGRMLAEAVRHAEERGYAVMVTDTGGEPEREARAAAEMGARRVDGLLYATFGLRRLDAPPQVSAPLVLANCFTGDGAYPAVVPAEVPAGRAAGEHLVGLGHRRLAMLSAPGGGPTGNMASSLRARGFRSATEGLDASVVPGGWTIDAGYAAAWRALTGPDGSLRPAVDRPTALFAVNDRAAVGALLAAARLGLDVPRDLSVIGFDDQEEVAANLVPALTTMALPHREMGARAVDLLLEAPAGERRQGPPEELECPLVVRGSTGPAPSA